MKRMWLIVVMLVCIGLQSCGSNSALTSAAQENGSCEVAPQPGIWNGAVRAGDYCEDQNDCVPNCCNCEFSQKTWLAVACRDNVCLSYDETCFLTRNDDMFCN